MKTKAIFLIAFIVARVGYSQNFINLDFEQANVSGYSPGDMFVPTSNALPGWTAYASNSSETDQQSTVLYDDSSLGAWAISVVDSNAPPYAPSQLQGNYSLLLSGGGPQAGESGYDYSASISQTGLVPTGTESLLFDASFYWAPTVTLGGQTINFTPLQTFSNYTLYGGNIPSDMAGQIETLTFTQPPQPNGAVTYLKLDDIQFSTSPAPEPGVFALSAFGGLFFAWRRWKK